MRNFVCFVFLFVIIDDIAGQGLGNGARKTTWQNKKPVVSNNMNNNINKPMNMKKSTTTNNQNVQRNSLSQPKRTMGNMMNSQKNTMNSGANTFNGMFGMGMGMGGNKNAMMDMLIAMRTHGVPTHQKNMICKMAGVSPPVNGKLPPAMQMRMQGFNIRHKAKIYGHDLDIYEGVAMCHNKAMDYRGCDKTPKPKYWMGGRGMPGMGGMGGPGPLGQCNINIPNSCQNPNMKCTTYHKDFFGVPICCAHNEMAANVMENMGF